MNKLKSIKLKSIKLKSIYLSLVALLVGVSATAQVWTLKNRESSSCDPKPYITFKFINGADTLFLGSDANATPATAVNIRTASSVSYSVGGGAPVSVPFFTNLDKTDSTLTYFLHDMYYLPAGAEVSVSVPAFSLRTPDGASIKQDAQIRTFTVDDVYEVKSSVRSSAIAEAAKGKSIVVKSPNVLTVDGELACKQLVVEAGGDDHQFGAGVVIENGANLTVGDTAYYLCNAINNRVAGYLINRGEYSAAASVFEKNVSNAYDMPYAKTYGYDMTAKKVLYSTKRPYFSIPVVDPDPVFSLGCNGRFNILLPYSKYKAGNGATLYYGLTMGKRLASEYPNELMQLCPLDDTAAVFRAKGSIFDEEYAVKELSILNVSDYGPGKTHYLSQCVVNNDYQAAIDWMSVVGDDEDTKRLLRVMDIRYDQASRGWSECNFITGLTTYDGPMRYGFLQPAMEPAVFPQLDSLSDGRVMSIGKKDLVSYADVPSDEMTTTLPFIRFYVNDVNPNSRKSVGTRSVFVAYFLPEEKLDSLRGMCPDEINSTFDCNFLWENLESYGVGAVVKTKKGSYAPVGGGVVFPFIGGVARKGGTGKYMSIKPYAIPEVEYSISMQNEVKIFAAPKQDKVEFGVLDYGNLGDLSVSCAGLSVNVKGKEDILSTVLNIAEKGDYVSSVSASGRYNGEDARIAALDLSTYMPKSEPSAIPSINLKDGISVRGYLGCIKVAGVGDYSVKVYDLAGACIASVSAHDEVTFSSLMRGGYIVEVSGADICKTELVRVF